jgi:hypothetical protein
MGKDSIYNRRENVSNKMHIFHKKWTFSTASRPNHDTTKPDNKIIQTKTEDIKITRIRTDTYYKSMGYFQSIGKTKQKQVETIKNKMEETHAEMREPKLSNNKFTFYFRKIPTPKITYNLGLTSISKTNSDTLTTKILLTSLRKRNFSGTTPNGVSLGSKKWEG